MKRKIIAVTGTRAEYGLLRPVLKALKARSSIHLKVVAAGMHLSRAHGHTVRDIMKDFHVAYRVPMDPAGTSPAGMARALGNGIARFAAVFQKEKPDMLLILGDRAEVLAAAMAAAYMNIFIAHIHGGDKSKGGIDESARHAITKLAHFHFAATPTSASRILKMGEPKKSVFLVGSPSLDDIRQTTLLSREALIKKLRLPIRKNEAYFLFLQHSVTTQFRVAGKQIAQSLKALQHFHMPTVAIFPNNDAGAGDIIRHLKRFERENSFFKTFKNLGRRDYLSLLKHAKVMIGNSSSGMIDSAVFKVPVVNIGDRQASRERSTNVIDVKENARAIIVGIKKAIGQASFAQKLRRCKNVYGDGHASERIAGTLSRVPLRPEMLQKQIVY